MFDLHSIHMLKNALKKFRDDPDYFKSMFPEISSDLRDKYYNLFASEAKIFVEKSYRKQENKSPQIIVRDAETNLLNTQLLSNGGPTKKTMLIRHDLILMIYAPKYDFVRILHRLIQSAFLIFKRSFLEAGYMNLDFVASQEFLPAEDTDLQDVRGIRALSSEAGIMYQREMIYTAQKLLEFEPIVADREVDVSVIMNVPADLEDSTSENLYTNTLYTNT